MRTYAADDFETIRKHMKKPEVQYATVVFTEPSDRPILSRDYLKDGGPSPTGGGWAGDDGNVVHLFYKCRSGNRTICPRNASYQCLNNKKCTPTGN